MPRSVVNNATKFEPGLIVRNPGKDVVDGSVQAGAAVPTHSHVSTATPWGMLWHTKYAPKDGGGYIEIPLRPPGHRSFSLTSLPAAPSHTFILNENSNFSLTFDTQAGGEVRTYQRSSVGMLGPGGLGASAMSIQYEMTLTFIQDEVGGWTADVWGYGNRDINGFNVIAPGLGSSTAGKALTIILRWLGPYVGWITTYNSGWRTLPNTLTLLPSAASTYDNLYMRGNQGVGYTTTHLDNLVTALNALPIKLRQLAYMLGVAFEPTADGATFITLERTTDGLSNTLTRPGYTSTRWANHTLSMGASSPEPIDALIHEWGHAIDFTFKRGVQGVNQNVWEDGQLCYLHSAYFNSITHTYYYAITEWIAQAIGCWALTKGRIRDGLDYSWYIEGGAYSPLDPTGKDRPGYDIFGTSTAFRTETFNYLDALFAGYY